MKKVLIVDDEKIVLDVLEKMISHLGHNTTVSETGIDALKKFKNNKFDLVFVDLLMPGVRGWELIQKFREEKPDQKIILVTGMGSDCGISQHRLKENNIDQVLPKPFSFNKVRSLLENINKQDI